MKKCFICGEMMRPISTYELSNGESIFRPDDAAHMDCLWNVAKLVVYGEMEVKSNEKD